MTTGWKWLAGACVLLIASAVGLLIVAQRFSKRIEPYLRDQAIRYLRDRFDGDVQLDSLHVSPLGQHKCMAASSAENSEADLSPSKPTRVDGVMVSTRYLPPSCSRCLRQATSGG